MRLRLVLGDANAFGVALGPESREGEGEPPPLPFKRFSWGGRGVAKKGGVSVSVGTSGGTHW